MSALVGGLPSLAIHTLSILGLLEMFLWRLFYCGATSRAQRFPIMITQADLPSRTMPDNFLAIILSHSIRFVPSVDPSLFAQASL